MARTIEIVVSPEDAQSQDALQLALLQHGIDGSVPHRLIKRSIDARSKHAKVRLRYEYGVESRPNEGFVLPERLVGNEREVHIVGAGPAGLFAAIELIGQGLKPVIIERGKDVRSRRRDLATLNKYHVVNPESNYCFGEGGAGTYSDGKLYTRSKKRGSVEGILQKLVAFGAPTDILFDAHPHIGTNKLPKLIEAMRAYILHSGGEVLFETKLTDLFGESGRLTHIQLDGQTRIPCSALILATGHSARDIFELLHHKGLRLEAKPFALGVRVEHPQHIIDRAQYHCSTDRGPFLPAAAYSMVQQVAGRGVYSFCMCPGGIIAPCATAPGEIVTNGWSPSKRNNPYANSGIVVSIQPEDFDPQGTGHPLAALDYQRKVEQAAFGLGGGGQVAPAQRMVDFYAKRVSTSLPKCSYQPGLRSADLRECLPPEVHTRLREAFFAFGKKMKGYFTEEAVAVATESRTSSPVRIPRGEDLAHPQMAGLYPTGEGAGYAGGIVSAAMDGERVAQAVVQVFKK